MSDICYTTIRIHSNNEKTAKQLNETIHEWMESPDGEPDDSEFGNGWMGNVAVNARLIESTDDAFYKPLHYSGKIQSCEQDGDDIDIFMASSWITMMEPLYRAIETNIGLDGLDITYSAYDIEGQFHITNDKKRAGSYAVEIEESASDDVKDTFGIEPYTHHDYDEDELKQLLAKAFQIDSPDGKTVEELLSGNDEPISAYRWEYEPIEGTF